MACGIGVNAMDESLLRDHSPLAGSNAGGSSFGSAEVISRHPERDITTQSFGASSHGIGAQFDPVRTFETAWHAIGDEPLKQVWENDFWSDFFNPVSDPLSSLTSKPLKRRVEETDPVESDCEVVQTLPARVDKRVESFLRIVKHGTVESWQESANAMWETAIRRWHSLVTKWSSDATLIQEIHSRKTFREQSQILVDLFFNKSPSTLLKRCNSLARLTNHLAASDETFPCSESQLYLFLCSERDNGAPSSRLSSLMQALTFSRHVLGMDELEACISSKRCHGAAQGGISYPLKQAPPLTVEHLKALHQTLVDDGELWNKVMAGMLLFCCYARARWNDAQHSETFIADYDDEGTLQFIEASTRVHKTAKAFHLRNVALPLVAPCFGVTEDNWGTLWILARDQLGVNDLQQFPLMPAPDKEGTPTVRPISTTEAGEWMNLLIQQRVKQLPQVRYTSHSLKATCLSYCAKRGMGFEDRLCLGYHAGPLRMALTYSRDGAARPLSLLVRLLSEIRQGTFLPDSTRSGRLVGRTELLTTDVSEPLSASMPDWNIIQIKDESSESEHATSCSSSSSDEESFVEPSTYRPQPFVLPENKNLWKHKKLRTCHLMQKGHRNLVLCGRRCTEAYETAEPNQRFDVSKCRQCFKSKLLA